MRGAVLSILAGSALAFSATAANAAFSVGAAGSTNGTAVPSVTSTSTLEFDTTNAAIGNYSSFFQFNNDSFTSGVFTATASTNPLDGTTVSMLQLFTGGTVSFVNGINCLLGCSYSGGALVSGGSTSGSSNSLTLNNVSLTPNTNYTFVYSGALGTTPGNISGNAAFAIAAVPEPATWGLMLLGFGGIGLTMRRRRRPVLAQIA
jgi:hypothetical protein